MIADLVYDVLVRECGAFEGDRRSFVSHFPTDEWRFIGKLGFGGKFWVDHKSWYVNCYRENETAERLDLIQATNAELAKLYSTIHEGD